MTTWTPATQQSETWTSEARGQGVFSQLVFSHASLGALHVFAFGNAAFEGWYHKPIESESWTPA